jgi:FixJ family two-component response regulator
LFFIHARNLNSPAKHELDVEAVPDLSTVEKRFYFILHHLIRSTGMEIRTFASAREFLKFKYRRHNSCIIVDIKLKEKSGLELQDELRATGSDLPVIFITGFDSPETRYQAKKSGAAGYFGKPIDPIFFLSQYLL